MISWMVMYPFLFFMSKTFIEMYPLEPIKWQFRIEESCGKLIRQPA